MPPRPHHGRKLLVASIGVATLNYVGVHCGGTTTTGGDHSDGGGVVDGPVGNLAAPDVVEDFPVANLVAFPDAVADVVDDFPVANLVAFPDAGSDTGGSDAKE